MWNIQQNGLLAVVDKQRFPATDPGRARKTSRPASTALLVRFFEWFGELGLFCLQLLRIIFLPPYEGREFAHQLDELGAKSLPLVVLAGVATGVVLSLETPDSVVRFGARSLLAALLVISIVKESGPIITGLIVSGRVAAGIGAELGAMKVSEQIDAMEVSAVDPYKFLVATRILACVLVLPLLTLAADFCGRSKSSSTSRQAPSPVRT